MTRVQTPMSGHIHPDDMSLNKTVGLYQLQVTGGVMLYLPPHSDLPRGGKQKETFPLGESIKNHINIRDVYQSKSWTSMSSALLILSLSAVSEAVDLTALTALFFVFFFSNQYLKGNQLERLTSVGWDSQLQLNGFWWTSRETDVRRYCTEV